MVIFSSSPGFAKTFPRYLVVTSCVKVFAVCPSVLGDFRPVPVLLPAQDVVGSGQQLIRDSAVMDIHERNQHLRHDPGFRYGRWGVGIEVSRGISGGCTPSSSPGRSAGTAGGRWDRASTRTPPGLIRSRSGGMPHQPFVTCAVIARQQRITTDSIDDAIGIAVLDDPPFEGVGVVASQGVQRILPDIRSSPTP